MRFSASNIANAAAWVTIFVLIGAALAMAEMLGFMGLLILGAATALVCVRAEMDQATPTWGTEVFKARMDQSGSPEQRAALSEERRRFVSPLRFYRWYGIFLVAIGLAGFLWQWCSGHG
jgi:hypothetical protein